MLHFNVCKIVRFDVSGLLLTSVSVLWEDIKIR